MISQDAFPRAMRAVVRELLPEPNAHLSHGQELRFGNHGSLSVIVDRGVWTDHESGESGGVVDLVARELRCSPAEAHKWLEERAGLPEEERAAPKPALNGVRDKPAIKALYDYHDEAGDLLFQVVRYEPKRFVQRRPDGRGGWDWAVKGVRRVPYRLPDVLEAIALGRYVFVVEGEKDADALWRLGLPATCNAGGAGKWDAGLNAHFAGADVVILPDKDEAGAKHRDLVAKALGPVAARVRALDLPDLPDKGDVSDWLARGGTAEALHDLVERQARGLGETARLRAKPYDPARVKALTKRQWLYGALAVRGYLSLIGAPGGVGKTAVSTAIALAVASGRALLHDTVHERAPVWFYQLEDDEPEMTRRIHAAMQHHQIADADIAGRLYVDSGRDQPLCIATRTRDQVVATPHVGQMIQEIRERGIGLLIVDPFVKCHQLEENRNEQINFAATQWALIAHETRCAVILLHHFRKGAVGGEADSFRGAAALIDACRSALALSPMTAEEGDHFGLAPEERRLVIRLDNAKANLAPRPEHARFVQLASETIHTGDNMQVARVFDPPGAFDGLSVHQCNAILQAIAARDGEPLSPHPRAQERWVGRFVIAEAGRMGVGVSEARVKRVLDTWYKSGALEIRDFKDEHRNQRQGVFSSNSTSTHADDIVFD